MDYNGTQYIYLHNLQGDVVGLVDTAGALVVEYKYDAWGRMIGRSGSLVSTLGYLNPFRYRGYVYDEETGLYYLRSRYYNPEWGRFINADVLLGEVGALLSHNVFAYCRNSPVALNDMDGMAPYAAIRENCVMDSGGNSKSAGNILQKGADILRNAAGKMALVAKAIAWLRVPDVISEEVARNMRANTRTDWWGYRSGVNSFIYYADAPQGIVRVEYYMVNYHFPFSMAEACEFGLACATWYDEAYLANMTYEGLKGAMVNFAHFNINMLNLDGFSIPWPEAMTRRDFDMLGSDVTILVSSDRHKAWAGMY